MVCGHVSGSGNYAELFFPYRLVGGVSGATLNYTTTSDLIVEMANTYVNISGLDTSYCKIVGSGERGFVLELKFSFTQQSNRPIVARFANGSSITFS